MLFRRTIICIQLLIPILSSAQDITGDWLTFNEKTGHPLSIISINRTANGSLFGRVKKIILAPNEGPDPVCMNCPLPFKDRKVIGLEFIWNFKWSGTAWKGGKILDPVNGEIYEGKIWMENDSTLQLRGYAGPFALFFRTETWKRAHRDNTGSIEGTWSTLDPVFRQEKSRLHLSVENGELTGKVLALNMMPYEGDNPICLKCPGELKNQPVVGMSILSGFSYDNSGEWSGKILDPGNGTIYKSTLWLNEKGNLMVRGFWGPFYRTQEWRRAE